MRSLVGLTLIVLGAVVLVLGALVVGWITAEDQRDARAVALREEAAAERELRALAKTLVEDAQDGARALVGRADRRLSEWIAHEPFTLYRNAAPPHEVDVEALWNEITVEVRRRSNVTNEHLDVVSQAMAEHATARIEHAAAKLREEARARARGAAEERRDRLVMRLGVLLLGMALLLAGTLYLLVIKPVERMRGAVNRIAGGDLDTPVGESGWPTREMRTLAEDVDRMREQMRGATQNLEAEVARKTERLAASLDERTRALEELGATQDRLVQAEKMAGLGTLAGGVAHEFNNLLGGILGCLESARAGTNDASVLEDLDMARRTADRATNLVDALLGVARPGERTFEPVDLRAVIEDVLRAAETTSRHRGVCIETEIEDLVPRVHGDEAQLHQVVLNLVTNALQSVDDGERVVVALARAGRQVRLEVRDEGPGVAEVDRRRVFEPFFTGRREGTGLGLFVSYGIVERHGGHIEVGDAPEGGARFTVDLPRSDGPGD